MTHPQDINGQSRSAGFTAWLALAAVLLLQLGTAAHKAQHSISDFGDVCEVCVQLEAGSATDTSAGLALAPSATDAVIDDWTDAPVVVSAYRTPQLRAPPALI